MLRVPWLSWRPDLERACREGTVTWPAFAARNTAKPVNGQARPASGYRERCPRAGCRGSLHQNEVLASACGPKNSSRLCRLAGDRSRIVERVGGVGEASGTLEDRRESGGGARRPRSRPGRLADLISKKMILPALDRSGSRRARRGDVTATGYRRPRKQASYCRGWCRAQPRRCQARQSRSTGQGESPETGQSRLLIGAACPSRAVWVTWPSSTADGARRGPTAKGTPNRSSSRPA